MGAVIPPRWHYRFENSRRAFLLLAEDFEQVIAAIRSHYLGALGELYDFLSAQKLKEPLN